MKPIYCGLQQREPPETPLIPKLRGHFAEFLNQRFPERLRLRAPPTCVSFSTVAVVWAFLGCASDDFIIQGLGLAARALLIARSPSTQRPPFAAQEY